MLTATQSKMDFMSTTEKAAFVLSLCYNTQSRTAFLQTATTAENFH